MTSTIAPPTLEELNTIIAFLEKERCWMLECDNTFNTNKLDIELYCLYAVRDGVGVGSDRAVLLELIAGSYNDGFNEGMREHISHNGGKPWSTRKQDYSAFLDSILSAVSNNTNAQSPWMGIETAPKDGTILPVDVYPTNYVPCMPLPVSPTQNSPPNTESE